MAYCTIQYLRTRSILYVCVIIFISFLSSCKNTDKEINKHPYENNLGIKPANLAQIDTVNYTTIEWINPVVNLGTLKKGDSAVIKFKYKNTGENPLFLSAVRTSCGCSTPHYSEEATMPDKEGELTVTFNTAGQAEEFHKTVTVTCNTVNGVRHVLSFDGRIESIKDINPVKP